jgi:hypothetical protein
MPAETYPYAPRCEAPACRASSFAMLTLLDPDPGERTVFTLCGEHLAPALAALAARHKRSEAIAWP